MGVDLDPNAAAMGWTANVEIGVSVDLNPQAEVVGWQADVGINPLGKATPVNLIPGGGSVPAPLVSKASAGELVTARSLMFPSAGAQTAASAFVTAAARVSPISAAQTPGPGPDRRSDLAHGPLSGPDGGFLAGQCSTAASIPGQSRRSFSGAGFGFGASIDHSGVGDPRFWFGAGHGDGSDFCRSRPGIGRSGSTGHGLHSDFCDSRGGGDRRFRSGDGRHSNIRDPRGGSDWWFRFSHGSDSTFGGSSSSFIRSRSISHGNNAAFGDPRASSIGGRSFGYGSGSNFRRSSFRQ